MKKGLLYLVIFSFCLLFGCSSYSYDNTQITKGNSVTSEAELKMPDAVKDFAENPDIQWMAGMLAVVENVDMLRGISQNNYEIFTEPGDMIRATITAQNGIDLSQDFHLMVFADGIQQKFMVGDKWYWTYPMKLTINQCSVVIEFAKRFSLNLGRLDFVLSFAEDPQADSHILAYTIWISLDSEVVAPSALYPTVVQRPGLQGSYGGGAYNAWLWRDEVTIEETDGIGPRDLEIQRGETIVLEAIASTSGLYRTVLIADGNPIFFEVNGEQCTYLDWESTGTNMLQLPITLLDVPSSGSIYMITTPITTGNLAQRILGSGKIELYCEGE